MSPFDQVQVVTPSRLHFGMFSCGQAGERGFGGLGVMVDRPGVTVTARRAAAWSFEGDLPERLELFARAWQEQSRERLPDSPVALTAHSAPDHIGLGTGTQLGLAVAAALELLAGRGGEWRAGRIPHLSAIELARLTSRGKRSAVGVHGFALGGLIIEAGKVVAPEGPHQISPLAAQATLPPAWRFVLARPAAAVGLAGDQERKAFERLPPTRADLSARLERTALTRVLPAAARGDCAAFAAALEEFGALAGECFAPVQGGLFANPQVAALAAKMRAAGAQGVAQSSWGPTVAAVAPEAAAAAALADTLRAAGPQLVIEIAAPSATGARWHSVAGQAR